MENKKVIIISIIAILIVGGVFWFGYNFAPGSYPYAEEYTFNVNEPDLISAVEFFKAENIKYCQPLQVQLKDGRGDPPDNNHWYHVYFYFPEENKIIKTWIQEQFEKNKTIFAFVAVNEGLTLGHWKYINKDFSDSENEAQKKKFEERILKKIEAKLGVKYN